MQTVHIKRLTLKTDNTYIDCVRFGTGKQTLILLPGLSFQSVKKAAFPLAYRYRIFAKRYTVYVFDKRAVSREGCTIRDMAEDVAGAMEQLHLSNADVFGVSQGGMIAQYLAIDHPQLVRRLVLSVTASRCNEVMAGVINDWVQTAEEKAYGALVMDMFAKMYSEAYRKKYRWLLPILSRVGKPKDFSRFITHAKACLTCDSYSQLQRITCPVFVIGGRQDLVVTGKASEEIAEALRCNIHMYDDLGHAAYDEAADHDKRIYAFLAR